MEGERRVDRRVVLDQGILDQVRTTIILNLEALEEVRFTRLQPNQCTHHVMRNAPGRDDTHVAQYDFIGHRRIGPQSCCIQDLMIVTVHDGIDVGRHGPVIRTHRLRNGYQMTGVPHQPSVDLELKPFGKATTRHLMTLAEVISVIKYARHVEAFFAYDCCQQQRPGWRRTYHHICSVQYRFDLGVHHRTEER
ncbi:hypothetical protein D3C80_1212420 [compost metagenome]